MTRRYPAYKDSGIEWLGKIPAHWGQPVRLKDVAITQPSNVDKKIVEGQRKVRLCNYVDVYKNEFITNDMPFMDATASEQDILKFQVAVGDVIITKDSEQELDIAEAAYVVSSGPDLVCGYHLNLIRPNQRVLDGRFLIRLFQSTKWHDQFEVAAKGITRVGLAAGVVQDALLSLPPLPEQSAIAAYLDEKTADIDRRIALLERKAAQYRALKQSLINETVTRGLDKTAPLKDSGVEWIGKVPAHWDFMRAKDLFINHSRRCYENDEIITAFRDGQVTLRANRRTTGFTNALLEHGYQRIEKGDLVVHAMDAFAGAIGISDSSGKSSPVYGVYTARNPKRVYLPYFGLLLREMALSGFIQSLSKGIRERSTEFRHKEL